MKCNVKWLARCVTHSRCSGDHSPVPTLSWEVSAKCVAAVPPSFPGDQLGPVTAWRSPQTSAFTRAINTGKCLLLLRGVSVAGWCLAINPEDGQGIALISKEPPRLSPVCTPRSKEAARIPNWTPVPISATDFCMLEMVMALCSLAISWVIWGEIFFLNLGWVP